MSLTNRFTPPHSALHQFFLTYMNVTRTETFLRNCYAQQDTWNIQIQRGPEAVKCAALVGIAFDYLVRATTWGLNIDDTVAAEVIYNPLFKSGKWLKNLWKNLKFQWAAHTTPPDETLIEYTMIFAWIEAIYRIRYWVVELQNAQQHNFGLTETIATVPEAGIHDLQNLLNFYRSTQALKWKCHKVKENPKFEGSADVGGADADWIIDQTLWDMKTTKYPCGSLHNNIEQILGYTLLDYKDQYHIEQVGLYYPRFGTTLEWPVKDLLYNLSGKEYSLEKWREMFQKFISNA